MARSSLINILARWDNELVPANIATERSLLIEVCAESCNDRRTTREPVNFTMVIDRSGSMRGWRLEAVKSAAVGIAEALNGNDRLSLVSFDDVVTRHFANVPMYHDGIRQARQEVECLAAGNMTNLSAGWFEGALCSAETMEQEQFRNGHVLVLSDGKANQGITRPSALAEHARELSDRGIRSSAVGIGADYSPLQLDAIAESGQGRLHDAETADDITDIVLGELGEIRNLAAHETRLHIQFPREVNIELLTRAPIQHVGEGLLISLGTLLANRPRPIALLAELPGFPVGTRLPFEITLSWCDPESGKPRSNAPVNSTLRVVPPAEAAAAQRDQEVVGRVADLWEATLAYQAMRYNEVGDFERATRLYQGVFDQFRAMVSELKDADLRIERLARAQRTVERSWIGRSKREALVMSKKMMLNEVDLRRRKSGDWHDHIR